jgi:hypothetical protein
MFVNRTPSFVAFNFLRHVLFYLFFLFSFLLMNFLPIAALCLVYILVDYIPAGVTIIWENIILSLRHY